MFVAQQRQKRYYDNNSTDKQFAVGDKVLLSTANLALKPLKDTEKWHKKTGTQMGWAICCY